MNHRGGIGAVLEVYNSYYENFNFISSYTIGTRFSKVIYFLISICKLIYTLCINWKIKVVHIHGASYGSFYRKSIFILISKFIFRKKVIYHVHGARFDLFVQGAAKPNGEEQWMPKLTRRLVKAILSRTDQLICLSHSWEAFFIDELNIEKDKVIVLNNVINVDYNTRNIRVEGKLKLVFLGEVGVRKGLYDLLDVIKTNKGIFENKIHLSIGGNGDTDYLQKFITEQEIGHFVSYVGWISGERKKSLLRESDILILPSYAEGLPISLLEGMAFGMPLISTNVGGIPEILFNGVNGILINPGNKEDIRNAILYFIKNPLKINEFGSKSMEIVYQFKPENVFRKLSEIYKSLL
jgi:glycosyltransferase involved in cell wall biosynthesis